MDLWQKLKERGIDLRHHRPGEHTTTCPECSHLRKPMNRSKPVLSVKIEGDHALFCCHHCPFKGAIYADGAKHGSDAKDDQYGARRSAGRAGAGPGPRGKNGPMDAARKKRWW